MEAKTGGASKVVETTKIFLKIKGMMTGSATKISPIDGLSKREQSKLERLMEAEKVTGYLNAGSKTFKIL